MDRTERFYKIEQLLQERRFATFAQIQTALGVSRATVKRDLQYLRDRLHAPIVYDRDNNGYHFAAPDRDAPRFELPGLWFNSSEIHALLTMQNLLEDVQPGLLGPHIAPLQARLKSLLGSQEDAPEEIARRIRILHAAKRQSDLKWFELIASTLLKRRRLRLRHWNRARDEETEREVSPQRLVHYRDNWYLDAWCHLRKEIRSFAVDAIRHATPLEQRAKELSKRDLDATLGAGYGIFSGAKVQWAKLRFTPESARWVASEQWHPQQKASTDAAGRYLLELPYSNPTELVMDILRHGAGVEVLAPPALRATVRRELSAAAAAYG
ncbi:helix-turn-helix transcriptional regulator [Sulfurisoma sediminicola]|uniref:Putative DNA-binding transcriptional regulator YafY n=1 Tax=Sulfurisoma sediminicola TaxID=1381557 RepID=A0A497XD06_9PROT|nr:WYL domain-containing protein [Sulfurisoma sediminicola]RLJ64833.1 putative DNA-binding transcriptional regulator YafY [Sulfurisoma sediminicola]